MRTILITGGSGYIGSHIAHLFSQQGYTVLVLDALLHGQQPVTGERIKHVTGLVSDQTLLESLFAAHSIYAVVHCAALIEVGASVHDPLRFYEYNVAHTVVLLQTMRKHGVKKFLFSSTCAVYGAPEQIPMSEDHSKNPMSPYGKTKLMVEQIVADAAYAHGLEFVCFRYFNAAGAMAEYGLCEQHEPETHLLPLIIRAAQEQKPIFVYGTSYDTVDGSCVRDFVHVWDIAQAHLQGLMYLEKDTISTVFNLGTGKGISVRQMIHAVEQQLNIALHTVSAAPREGDPAILVADASRAHDLLGWKPRFSTLEFIVQSACAGMYVARTRADHNCQVTSGVYR